MFKRKWHWILIPFICIGIAGFVSLSSKAPSEPIKIYKAVTLAPTPEMHAEKTEPAMLHGQAQPFLHHDRRDDHTFEVLSSFGEPREGFNTQTTDNNNEEANISPPPGWYKTEDPELHAVYFYAQLLKQFGDTPEVHTVAEYNLNVASGRPQTTDKIQDFLEANYHLFPNEKNRKAIEDFQRIQESGTTIGFQ